jgi:putative flippase GtrA
VIVMHRPQTRLLADPRWQDRLLLMRFGPVGLLNAPFGYAAFVLLLWRGIWPSVALVVAAVAASAFNFQTSRRLVFLSRGRVVRYAAVYVVVLAINWTALCVLRGHSLSGSLSQALLTLPVAAVSFVGQRRFVFPRAGRPA